LITAPAPNGCGQTGSLLSRSLVGARIVSVVRSGVGGVPHARGLPALCDLGIFMEKIAESIAADDLDISIDRVWQRSQQAGGLQVCVPGMRPRDATWDYSWG
jgi:hypothetical protein